MYRKLNTYAISITKQPKANNFTYILNGEKLSQVAC